MARFYSGVTPAVDAIAPGLRQYGAKRAKEDIDMETGAQRARGPPGGGSGAGGDDALEGTAGEGPRGRGRGRGGGGRGRGRGALPKAGNPAAAEKS
eukprot:3907795-Pyramimonas_sp.AAC.1